ncbi:MAG: type II toxin-antitoxin system RelE/ParE family toxin [Gammaproteobacteria bacterium]|nr:type II toxin-antitoxin system RelE/ParE family toxin [Gammaproteobacteria bacterium]
MKLRWTPHSIADLRAIHDYIAEDSHENALRMIDRLTSREDQIIAFPQSGRMVPETEREDIREIIEAPYRIIYHVLPECIDVLTVMHGARILREIPGVQLKKT